MHVWKTAERERLYRYTWAVLAQLGAKDREEAAYPALASPVPAAWVLHQPNLLKEEWLLH